MWEAKAELGGREGSIHIEKILPSKHWKLDVNQNRLMEKLSFNPLLFLCGSKKSVPLVARRKKVYFLSEGKHYLRRFLQLFIENTGLTEKNNRRHANNYEKITKQKNS